MCGTADTARSGLLTKNADGASAADLALAENLETIETALAVLERSAFIKARAKDLAETLRGSTTLWRELIHGSPLSTREASPDHCNGYGLLQTAFFVFLSALAWAWIISANLG